MVDEADVVVVVVVGDVGRVLDVEVRGRDLGEVERGVDADVAGGAPPPVAARRLAREHVPAEGRPAVDADGRDDRAVSHEDRVDVALELEAVDDAGAPVFDRAELARAAPRAAKAHGVVRRQEAARRDLGSTRVIQRLFNVRVPRARVPKTASTLRDRSER